MMAKNPDKRFLSWDKVVEEIDAIFESKESVEETEDKKRRHVRRCILIGSSLMLIVILATMGPGIFKHKAKKVKTPPVKKVVEQPKIEDPQQALLEKQQKDQVRVQQALRIIERETIKLEEQKKYQQALELWKYYIKNGNWKDHPLFKTEANRAVTYYKEKIKRQKKGLLHE
jgi:hypothetical protein